MTPVRKWFKLTVKKKHGYSAKQRRKIRRWLRKVEDSVLSKIDLPKAYTDLAMFGYSIETYGTPPAIAALETLRSLRERR